MQRPEQIKVLMSADYEVFHGRNFGSDDQVLFGPTEDLLKTCEAMEVPVTLFADVCSVWAHKSYGLNDFVEKFESQLRSAWSKGHDVQLHIHPHWCVADWRGEEWGLKEQRVHLSEFADGAEMSRREILTQGRDYLEGLLSESKNYHCVAFRAGGLALQPNEKDLIKDLLDLGIKIDSSVAKGLKLNLDTVQVDYTDEVVPEEMNWFLSDETGLRGGSDQGLFEIPVATFQMGLFHRGEFLARRLKAIRQRRGAGLSRAEKQTRMANLKTLVLENLRYLGKSPYFLLSADTKGFTSKMLLDGFDDFLESHEGDRPVYLSMLNHPKLLFQGQIHLLREFIEGLKSRYGSRLSFVTYSDVAKEVC